MTNVPWYSDNGGLGQSFQEELHGRDHLLDLLLTADVVRELREITGQACLMHLGSTPQVQIISVCGAGNMPQHYKPNETNLLSFMFYLGTLNTGILHIFHFKMFPDSNLRTSVDYFRPYLKKTVHTTFIFYSLVFLKWWTWMHFHDQKKLFIASTYSPLTHHIYIVNAVWCCTITRQQSTVGFRWLFVPLFVAGLSGTFVQWSSK